MDDTRLVTLLQVMASLEKEHLPAGAHGWLIAEILACVGFPPEPE